MPPDFDVPDAFDVFTLVILRRPENAPEMSEEELEDLQRRHLAYRADLGRQGLLAVNGPCDGLGDPSYRGMSIFACDPAQAARLSDGDPSVAAGRLTYHVMKWWVAAGSLDFPNAGRPVGERRAMPRD